MPPNGKSVNALSRVGLAEVINGSPYAQARKASGEKGNIISGSGVGKWIHEQGCPVNSDGKTLRLDDVSAWLAVRYKDNTQGGGSDKDIAELKKELIKSQIRANETNSEYREVKTELESFKAKLQNGELLSRNDVEKGYVERARFLRGILEELPGLASRLHDLNINDAREELIKIRDYILSRLSSEGE